MLLDDETMTNNYLVVKTPMTKSEGRSFEIHHAFLSKKSTWSRLSGQKEIDQKVSYHNKKSFL